MKFISEQIIKFKLFVLRSGSLSVVIFLVIMSVLFASGTAYAGLFSFLAPSVEGETGHAKISKAVNSQNMALLSAAVNVDPNPNKTANIAPVLADVLVPQIAESNGTDTAETSIEISTYTVRDGDTIGGIAKMFHVSANTILWANDLTSKSVLKSGETLIILPVSGIMYTVKKGDTVSGIAKKYNADENDIIAYNDLSVTSLQVGESIIIPDAEITIPKVSSPKSGKKDINEPILDNVSKLPSYPGYYLRPVSVGRISQKLHGHNGIDFAAPVGTPIYASAGGTVIISRINGGWNGGYGNFVVISHPNGTQSLYAHMQSKVVVKAGDIVAKGETVGYIGMTGLTTGPHVHFEIRGAKNPF